MAAFLEFFSVIPSLIYFGTTLALTVGIGSALYTVFFNDETSKEKKLSENENSNETQNDVSNVDCDKDCENECDKKCECDDDCDDECNDDCYDDCDDECNSYIREFVDGLDNDEFEHMMDYIAKTQVIVNKYYYKTDIQNILDDLDINKKVDDETFDFIVSKYDELNALHDKMMTSWLSENIVSEEDEEDESDCDDSDYDDMPPLVSDSDDDDEKQETQNNTALQEEVSKVVEEVVKELKQNNVTENLSVD